MGEELGDLFGQSKYDLSFYYRGEKMGYETRLGEKNIGITDTLGEKDFLLCLKGGGEGPKIF